MQNKPNERNILSPYKSVSKSSHQVPPLLYPQNRQPKSDFYQATESTKLSYSILLSIKV